MGATDNKLFFLGNILKHKDGKALDKYLSALGKQVICLGNDYLYDGGGLFFCLFNVMRTFPLRLFNISKYQKKQQLRKLSIVSIKYFFIK